MSMFKRAFAVIALGAAVAALPATAAENPSSYVSYHSAGQTVVANPSGKEFTYSSFRDRYNPNDDLTACSMGYPTGACYGSASYPELYQISRVDYWGHMRYKIWLPPGTRYLNLIQFTNKGNEMKTAARLDVPPVSGPGAALTSWGPGENFKQLLAGNEIVAKNGDGTVLLSASPSPLATPLQEGHWLYVHVLTNDASYVYRIEHLVRADGPTYESWYNCSPSPFDAVSGDPVVSTCNPEPLDLPGTAAVRLGETTQISPLAGSAASYSSSNTGVATVDNSGKVTGKAEGTVTVTGTGYDGSTDTTTVTVDPAAPLTVPASRTISLGETSTLTPTGGIALSFASSDTGIVTVNVAGQITGQAVGTATVTATGYDIGGEPNTAETVVTVEPPPPLDLPSALTTYVGSSTKLNALQGVPVSFSSADTSIATVNDSGYVTGVAEGTVVITGTDAVGETDTTTVTVEASQAIDITATHQKLVVGMVWQVPYTGGGDNVSFSSTSTSVATVDNKGWVTAAGPGSATIRVQDGQGNQDSMTVEVVSESGDSTPPPSNDDPAGDCTISFFGKIVTVPCEPDQDPVSQPDESGLELPGRMEVFAGDSKTIEPLSGTVASWSSSNAKVATIDANGVVTGVKEGLVVITATDADGNQDTVVVDVITVMPKLGDTTFSLDGTETQSSFFGGITPHGELVFDREAFDADETVDALMRITVDPEHRGKQGAVFLLGAYNGQVFFRTADGQWEPWDFEMETLEPFRGPRSLQLHEHVILGENLGLKGLSGKLRFMLAYGLLVENADGALDYEDIFFHEPMSYLIQ